MVPSAGASEAVHDIHGQRSYRRRRNRNKKQALGVPPVLNLIVRLLSGEEHGPFCVPLDGSVWDLQLRLCVKLGLRRALARCMSLICDGQLLSPMEKLSACKVPDGATLQLLRTPAQFIRTMFCCPCLSPHPDIPEGSSEPAIKIWPEERSVSIHVNSACRETFTFDTVYAAEENAAEAFEGGTRDIVEGVMDGYNGSVIAWGMTGTGKQRLLYGGSGAPPGMLPRAFSCIASRIAETPRVTHVVTASFLCVFMDRVLDLLPPRGPPGDELVQPADPGGRGATERVCKSDACLLRALQDGLRALNGARFMLVGPPSLMHTVFTVTVEAYEPRQEGGFKRRISKFLTCKLAGAENLKNTKLCSLMGLLFDLSKTDSFERKAAPYHEPSSIATLLQDSLGGSAQTCWIATAAPHRETLGSLWTAQLAERAKRVLNHPSISETCVDAIPHDVENNRWPVTQG